MVNGSRVTANGRVGHAWLADGYKIYQHTYKAITNNTVYSSENKFYAHYNFGWGGGCDGYFLLGSVDLRTHTDSLFTNTSIGDLISPSAKYYNIELGVLYYEL